LAIVRRQIKGNHPLAFLDLLCHLEFPDSTPYGCFLGGLPDLTLYQLDRQTESFTLQQRLPPLKVQTPKASQPERRRIQAQPRHQDHPGQPAKIPSQVSLQVSYKRLHLIVADYNKAACPALPLKHRSSLQCCLTGTIELGLITAIMR